MPGICKTFETDIVSGAKKVYTVNDNFAACKCIHCTGGEVAVRVGDAEVRFG
jgi:hypothetical protein